MEEARYEPAVPGANRNCFICLGPLESPVAMEPCGHVFCHGCIQRQAATAAGATCPLCRDPIWATRPLQGQDNRAGVAPDRGHGHLHPFVVRWRPHRGHGHLHPFVVRWRQQQQQQRPGPGGRRRRSFSDGDREQSPPPVPIRRNRIVMQEWFWPGPWQEGALWPRWMWQEELGSGDHVPRIPLNPFEAEPPWPL